MISLAGTWKVILDAEAKLSPEDLAKAEGQNVNLPGSLDENGIGDKNPDQFYLGGLSRKVTYTGVAWYSRTVNIPKEMRGGKVRLFLERCHWFTQLWINGIHQGSEDSLCVPHQYDFSLPDSDAVNIMIRIDNTPHINIGRIGHSITDWTQTNWNGVIGQMTLELVDELTLDSRKIGPGGLVFTGRSATSVTLRKENQLVSRVEPDTHDEFEIVASLDTSKPWSDDSPSLQQFTLENSSVKLDVATGTRTFKAEGRFFHLNGNPVFLRGTLETCVFPRTGYPPMDTQEWVEIFTKVKEFGLNHVRFHSWCPPEAAFVSADKVGVLLQVECPLWTGHWALSSDKILLEFIRAEAFRILDTHGHHPSFVMFCLGNEMAFYGEEPEVDSLLEELKGMYPHILFNFSSHGTHLSKSCDYYVQADNGKPGAANRPLRGSTWFGVGSRFDRESPSSSSTCNEASDEFDRPVVAHEVGEWAVFPDLSETSLYDGVLAPRNFNYIAQMLEKRGMLSQAEQFTLASGKLSASLYKEEIETLLRTRGLAGYQLLGLTDFPGQGTATIGMLNAFWKEKGFIEADQFSQFCAQTVPLLSLDKFVWKSNEQLTGTVSVAHSGQRQECDVTWSLQDESQLVVAEGTLGLASLIPSEPNVVGEIQIDLSGLPSPAKYVLKIQAGTAKNEWSIWIFDDAVHQTDLVDAVSFQWYREDVRSALKSGKKVWLRMHPHKVHTGIWGRFAPAFWSPIHFVEQVGTMGTLIKADHPIFNEFPTSSHSDWQWWEILTNSKALNLNNFPLNFQPELQVIDRYERNDKLGTIFEAQVGTGRLLVTFIDFDTPDRPASSRLEHSIRAYLNSHEFNPKQSIDLKHLDQLFNLQP